MTAQRRGKRRDLALNEVLIGGRPKPSRPMTLYLADRESITGSDKAAYFDCFALSNLFK